MHHLSNDRGAAAVEFALVLPLLIVLVFGIFEFGRGYNAKLTLTHAAREGARALAVGESDPAQFARDAAGPLSDDVSVTVGTCTPGGTATVTVTYPFTYNVPVIGVAISSVTDGTQTLTLSSTGAMRCGG